MLSLDDLGHAAGLSRFYLLRAFTQTLGKTPHAYLTDVRLHQAKRSLARGASVTETCFAVGYESLGSFSTLFARRIGESPRVWQARTRALISAPDRRSLLWVPGCLVRLYGGSNFREAPGSGSR